MTSERFVNHNFSVQLQITLITTAFLTIDKQIMHVSSSDIFLTDSTGNFMRPSALVAITLGVPLPASILTNSFPVS